MYESKQSTITALLEPLILQQANGTKPAGRGNLYVIPDCHADKILYESVDAASVSAYGDHKPTKRAVGVSGVVTLFPSSDLNANSRAAEGDAKKLNRPAPIGTRCVRHIHETVL